MSITHIMIAAVANITGPISTPPPTPPTKREECIKKWRKLQYVAHAADLTSTIVALETNKGREANPVITGIFGKNVNSAEVAAYKLVTAVGMDFLFIKSGDSCTARKISTLLTLGVAGANLRVFF